MDFKSSKECLLTNLITIKNFFIIIFMWFSVTMTSANDYYGSIYDFYTGHDYANLDFPDNEITSSEKNNQDPLELVNRHIFAFNLMIDQVFTHPASEFYRVIVPPFGRDRVDSFLKNLTSPVIFINNLLQGDLKEANNTFWRFVVNTSIGALGIVDVASEAGLPYKQQDFSKTLSYYKVPAGPYLVVPLLGPTSVSDLGGKIVDFGIMQKTITPILKKNEKTDVDILKVVHYRAVYFELISDRINNSIDPYTTMKSLYLQNRNNFNESKIGNE